MCNEHRITAVNKVKHGRGGDFRPIESRRCGAACSQHLCILINRSIFSGVSEISETETEAHRPLAAGVVGAGVFGGIHASKYAGLPGVDFKGVFDPAPGAAARVVEKVEAGSSYDSLDALLADIDLVTVAAPASFHFDVALQALEAGKHVLVEKPIALTTDHADKLVALAERDGLVLQVGHQERYVFDAFGVLDRPVPPTEIFARRAGVFSGRGMDVSVVMDLMIHDLDLVRQLTGADLSNLKVDAKREHGEQADEVPLLAE